MDFNPMMAPPPMAAAPAKKGGNTTLYIVIFFLCVISVMAGAFYFQTQSAAAKAKADLEKIQADTAAKMAAAKSDFEKQKIQAEAAEKTRSAQLRAELAGKEAALEAKAKSKEAQLKALEAKVNADLKAAAATVKNANELKAKAANERNTAVQRLREANAAKAKAEASGKAIDKKLADEKAKLARDAAAKVAAANKKAADATRQAQAEAAKAQSMKAKLNQVNATLAGREFARAAPYAAVPGYGIPGAKFKGDTFNVSGPKDCAKQAKAKGANVWGFRNAEHSSAKYRNSCFFYSVPPSSKYGGNKDDRVHMIGCAVGGNPRTGCTALPVTAPSMSNDEAKCYLMRYGDLRNAFGNSISQAKKHWKNHGFKEKRDKSCNPIRLAFKRSGSNGWCADEGGQIRCNRGGIGGWEKQEFHHLGGGKFAIKGGRNKKWCADEGNKIKCNRGGIGGWEKFSVLLSGTKNAMYLRGGRNNKWCRPLGSGKYVKCSSSSVSGAKLYMKNW
jgi:hypothetical protein